MMREGLLKENIDGEALLCARQQVMPVRRTSERQAGPARPYL
jgi:cobalamin biosynthesis protein CobT